MLGRTCAICYRGLGGATRTDHASDPTDYRRATEPVRGFNCGWRPAGCRREHLTPHAVATVAIGPTTHTTTHSNERAQQDILLKLGSSSSGTWRSATYS